MSKHTFTLFTGPMCGGKSSALLSYIDRCRYQKKLVVAFKPRIDVRYDATSITTHSGWKTPAVLVGQIRDVYEHMSHIDKPDVVAFDEAFMIDGSADALIWLFRQGISIAVSTLDLDCNCKPFKEPQLMMPWATKIVKCSSVCTVCGADAYYTHKKVAGGDEIEVGGLDLYEPRCWEHHPFFINQ